MKKYRVLLSLSFLILASLTFSTKCYCQTVSKKEPQKNFEIHTADFDGDKIADTLTVLKNIKQSEISKQVIKCNPFGGDKPAAEEPISLLIRLSKNFKSYLIYDSAYFATPSWNSGEFKIKIINKGDKLFKEWKKSVKSLNGAAVILGTEAGIDILLYWDKSKFKVFWPDEEP